MSRNLKELIRQMTLEEKAGLCSGADFWNTMGIERLGIPSVMMTDGPHGLRKQEVRFATDFSAWMLSGSLRHGIQL